MSAAAGPLGLREGGGRAGRSGLENPPSGTPPLQESDPLLSLTAVTSPNTTALIPAGECRIIPARIPHFSEL